MQATEALRITAPELVRFGVMDEIIPEPLGGAHSDPMGAFPAIKDAIMRNYHKCARCPTCCCDVIAHCHMTWLKE